MGADKNQFLKAIREAEAYDGPSIIIAYAPCINHGIKKGMNKAQESHEGCGRLQDTGICTDTILSLRKKVRIRSFSIPKSRRKVSGTSLWEKFVMLSSRRLSLISRKNSSIWRNRTQRTDTRHTRIWQNLKRLSSDYRYGHDIPDFRRLIRGTGYRSDAGKMHFQSE